MDTDKTESLHIFFPSIFTKDFYFECENGWYDIIFDLCKKITAITDKCMAVQVKEKFHGLRFYIEWKGYGKSISDATVEKLYKLIQQTESDSYYVCEICGVAKQPKEKYCQDCSKKLFK